MKIFLSMSFKGKTEEEIVASEKLAKLIAKDLLHCSNIEVLCNYWYSAPENGEKKLHELSNALKLMAECDYLFLVYNKEGKLPEGCKVERMAWETCKDAGRTIVYLHEADVM